MNTEMRRRKGKECPNTCVYVESGSKYSKNPYHLNESHLEQISYVIFFSFIKKCFPRTPRACTSENICRYKIVQFVVLDTFFITFYMYRKIKEISSSSLKINWELSEIPLISHLKYLNRYKTNITTVCSPVS